MSSSSRSASLMIRTVPDPTTHLHKFPSNLPIFLQPDAKATTFSSQRTHTQPLCTFTPKATTSSNLESTSNFRDKHKMFCTAVDIVSRIPAVGTLSITPLLGLIIICIVYWNQEAGRKGSRLNHDQNSVSGCASSQANVSGTDVIIVGAGVAGSALAHTLGKVHICFIQYY